MTIDVYNFIRILVHSLKEKWNNVTQNNNSVLDVVFKFIILVWLLMTWRISSARYDTIKLIVKELVQNTQIIWVLCLQQFHFGNVTNKQINRSKKMFDGGLSELTASK